MVRKVVVEIELEEGTNLEDMLRGVKHRVLREGLWDEVQKVRRETSRSWVGQVIAKSLSGWGKSYCEKSDARYERSLPNS